jgi:large subunit ribosomal protein L10
MSKQIKQMEMDTLKQSFQGVRDLVVLSISKVNATADNGLRQTLRKKNIRLQVVKNSLTRRVFGELGFKIPDDSPYWAGPSTIAYGAGSIAELSQAIEAELKGKTGAQYKDKVRVKGAVSDGVPVTFEQALKMPTRAQAIARVISLALAPASRLVSQITAPASRVAGQIKEVSKKEPAAAPEGGAPAEAPAPAP